MRRTTSSLSRTNTSVPEADTKYLNHKLSMRWHNVEEQDIITTLVNRYHSAVYGDINEISHAKSPLATVTLLDNYAYLMGRVKGGKMGVDRYGWLVNDVYRSGEDMLCKWREAPLKIRRKAMVVLRFISDLPNFDMLPEEYAQVHSYEQIPSTAAVEMGCKHWNRLDELIDMVNENMDIRLGTLDAVLSDRIHKPLQAGAL